MDNLVTIKESFLIVLDSRNSIQLNKSWNSSVDFQFEDPINQEDGYILMTGSILNFAYFFCKSSYSCTKGTNALSIGSIFLVNSCTSFSNLAYLAFGISFFSSSVVII